MSRVFCSAGTESSAGKSGERLWIVATGVPAAPQLAPGVALREQDPAVGLEHLVEVAPAARWNAPSW